MLTKKEEKSTRAKIDGLLEEMLDINDIYHANVLMHSAPERFDDDYYFPYFRTSYTFIDSHNQAIKSMNAMRGSNEYDGRIIDKLAIPNAIGKKRLDVTIKRLKQNNKYLNTLSDLLFEIEDDCTQGLVMNAIRCLPLQKNYELDENDYYYGIELFVAIKDPEEIENSSTAHYYSIIRDNFDEFLSIMVISKFARIAGEDGVNELIEDLSGEPVTESGYKRQYNEERRKNRKLQDTIDKMKLEITELTEAKNKSEQDDAELQKLRKENKELQKKIHEMEARLKEQESEESSSEESSPDTTDLERRIAALSVDLEKTKTESTVLHSRLDSLDNLPLLIHGKEKDLYPGEVKDMILDSLSDYVRLQVHDGSRRKDIIDDVLTSNDFEDNLTKRRNELRRVMKNENPQSLLRDLQQFGIKAEPEQKTHYKLVYYGDPRYVTVMAKTASDKASYDNMTGNILRDFM